MFGERENKPKQPEVEFYEKLTYPQHKIIEALQQDIDIKLQIEIMQMVKAYISIVKIGLEKAKQDGIDMEPIIEEERKKFQQYQ